MEMEKQLNDGFGCKSVYPSIVPSPAFNSDKKRFSVPHGIDDKLPSHQSEDNKAQTIGSTVFNQEALQWLGKVSKEVSKKRTDAFNVSFPNIKTVEDAARIIKEVSSIK
jgi:hypothetical protein